MIEMSVWILVWVHGIGESFCVAGYSMPDCIGNEVIKL